MDTPGPGVFKISEPWLLEWVEQGIQRLVQYLARYAEFEAWLSDHPERSLDG